MKRKHVFLMIAILGLCYTWYYNILFFLEHDNTSIIYFFEMAQINYAGKSFGADLTVVVLTFFVWYIPDVLKLKVKNWWALIPLTFLVAIAFAFPLYLYMKESRLEQMAANE